MAHFAELNDDNYVIRVLVVPDDQEHRGNDYLSSDCGLGGKWIQTSYNSRIRGVYAGTGYSYDEEYDVFTPTKRPASFYVYDSETKDWVCPPELHPITGKRLTASEKKAIEAEKAEQLKLANAIRRERKLRELLESDVPRFQTHIRLFGATPSDGSAPLHEACNTTDYVMVDLTSATHGNSGALPKVYYFDEKHNKRFDAIQKFETLIDFAPYGYVTHSVMVSDEKAEELGIPFVPSQVMKETAEEHPQTVARSLHEFFRLVIEWAYAYTDLGNTEPTAVVADKLLQIVQMPLDVRNDLLSLPEQPVSKYLRGDPSAAQEAEETPPMPESFKEWFCKLVDFPLRNGVGFNVEVNTSRTEYIR